MPTRKRTAGFSPREFMQHRHPTSYSDSTLSGAAQLERPQLEYHLDTITNRSQETQFANFAREIASRTICPNLLPQTGPTGGGDSKVDSETYPVADAISELWFGLPKQASSERWAFAFSAKKNWKPKVESDVAKAHDTDRNYTKIYFISNQFIADKARAQSEDKLRAAHGVDVRILDRNWLIDQVFSKQLEHVAIEQLGLPKSYAPQRVVGPLDYQKQTELNEITQKLESDVTNNQQSTKTAEHALDIAILSRELERPRSESDALFARAIEYARKYGTTQHTFAAIYEQAWTSFWWHEDPRETETLYSALEVHAARNTNAHEYEKLLNLWHLLETVPRIAESNEQELRTQRLLGALGNIEADTSRPSNRLLASLLRLALRLNISFKTDNATEINQTLEELSTRIKESDNHLGFRIDSFVQIVLELGDALSNYPAYTNLYETALETKTRRAGQSTSAETLFSRAIQHYRAGQYTQTIRILGRSLTDLTNTHYTASTLQALLLCSDAYAQLGLLWAARGTALHALMHAFKLVTATPRVSSYINHAINAIKWIELRLARLPHTFSWHELDELTKSKLAEAEHDNFELVLSSLFTTIPFEQLRDFERIPRTLERLNLPFAATVLKFALGHEEEAASDFLKLAPSSSSDGFRELLLDARKHSRDVVATPLELGQSRNITMRSAIAGVQIEATSVNHPSCLLATEAVLATLEAMLATAIADRLFGLQPTLTIKCRVSDFQTETIAHTIEDDAGEVSVTINCRSPPPKSNEDRQSFRGAMFDAVTTIFANCFHLPDADQNLEQLFARDAAADRALLFACMPQETSELIGNFRGTSINDWQASGDATALTRAKAWDADLPAVPALEPEPKQRPDLDLQRHDQLAARSPIRLRLWSAARWRGAGYFARPNGPPILALIFEDENAARQIFDVWMREFGPEGAGIRISIVRGTSATAPHQYRMLVGPEPIGRISTETMRIMLSRIQQMDPPSSDNLNEFLRNFAAHGSYWLAAAIVSTDGRLKILEPQIQRQQLAIRNAFELTLQDLESMVLSSKDDPLRPDDQRPHPVDDVLQFLNSRKR